MADGRGAGWIAHFRLSAQDAGNGLDSRRMKHANGAKCLKQAVVISAEPAKMLRIWRA